MRHRSHRGTILDLRNRASSVDPPTGATPELRRLSQAEYRRDAGGNFGIAHTNAAGVAMVARSKIVYVRIGLLSPKLYRLSFHCLGASSFDTQGGKT